MTEFELFQALRPLYPAAEYALLPQVASGTGRAKRHCDALALSLWPSRGLHLSGFEIKSYRGDWLCEKRDPEKAEELARYCNFWWIVASGAFVKPEEIPELWGLLVWDEKKSALVKAKPARFREAEKPDLPFIAAALRKAQDVVTPTTALSEAREAGYKQGFDAGVARSDIDIRDLASLRARVTDFEKASGIKLSSGWHDGKELGAAVNQIVNGTAAHERKALLRIAGEILREFGESSVQIQAA
jgi:hypothetical protein